MHLLRGVHIEFMGASAIAKRPAPQLAAASEDVYRRVAVHSACSARGNADSHYATRLRVAVTVAVGVVKVFGKAVVVVAIIIFVVIVLAVKVGSKTVIVLFFLVRVAVAVVAIVVIVESFGKPVVVLFPELCQGVRAVSGVRQDEWGGARIHAEQGDAGRC